MRRLHEPLQRHIHDKLVSELNEMSIRIKLWEDPEIAREDMEVQNKIIAARQHHPQPDWMEILSLIDRCRDEMNQCTEPYKRY